MCKPSIIHICDWLTEIHGKVVQILEFYAILCKAVKICENLCKVVQICAKFYKGVQNCAKVWKIVQRCAKMCKVVQSCAKLCIVVQSCAKLCKVVQSCVTFHISIFLTELLSEWVSDMADPWDAYASKNILRSKACFKTT